MGILEIHFHDSDFSWTVNPRGSDEKTLSFSSGESSEPPSRTKSASSGAASPGSGTGEGSFAGKLWMLGALAVFVGAGLGLSKLRNRRRTESAESEQDTSGRRLSLSRSK